MEQGTPTLQPEEPTVTQLPVEECKQEPASPTPFLPMPKSAAATQLDTDMDKEQEEVPAWFNYSPTSPADEPPCEGPQTPSVSESEDDDGLQQQLQRAEHLTMTLHRVNVRDSDSELSGISDEDDEEEPDDKMSQKDEDQDEHQDQDEWRWMPLESGRWQGAQLLRLERQWQDAGFPKLGTEAGDRQAIGSTHKFQQRRRPMSLRQASMTTCLTRMVELRRGYPGLDNRRRGRA